MILGVDIGNYATKTSQMINFVSKCSKVDNILGNKKKLESNGETHYIEEGTFDTEYQKVKKKNYMAFLLTAIVLSSNSVDTRITNSVVVGLPLSQYKQDKDDLKELVLENKVNVVHFNGVEKQIIIDDCFVAAEGVSSILNIDFEGIVIDIGGRTTDIALITNVNGIKRVANPFSLPHGTLNLYNTYINTINNKYSLDLKLDDAERILRNGLKICGIEKDISFAVDVFKEFVEELVKILQVEYSIKTLDVICTGGGSELLYKPLKKRIPQLQITDNSFYANALGYESVGEQLWLN